MSKGLPTSKRVVVILTCAHAVLGVPGEAQAFCARCDKTKSISDIQVLEWSAWCRSPGCRYTRYFGMARDLAERAAKLHVIKNGSHVIDVEFKPVPEWVRLKQDMLDKRLLRPYDPSMLRVESE